MASAASLFPSGGLGFPVTVRGPWRAPTVAPDLARAIPGLLEDAAGLAPGAAEAIGQGLGSVLDGARDADETAPLDALKGLLRPFQ